MDILFSGVPRANIIANRLAQAVAFEQLLCFVWRQKRMCAPTCCTGVALLLCHRTVKVRVRALCCPCLKILVVRTYIVHLKCFSDKLDVSPLSLKECQDSENYRRYLRRDRSNSWEKWMSSSPFPSLSSVEYLLGLGVRLVFSRLCVAPLNLAMVKTFIRVRNCLLCRL